MGGGREGGTFVAMGGGRVCRKRVVSGIMIQEYMGGVV